MHCGATLENLTLSDSNMLILLRSILEASDNGVFVVDSKRNVLYHNRRFLDLWQLPEDTFESMKDKPFQDRILALLLNPVSFFVIYINMPILPEKRQGTLELIDGRVFEWSFVPTYFEGNLTGNVWTFTDITNIRQTEKELCTELAMRISQREREVLVLVGQGFTSREIASQLSISIKTVSNHRARILDKLDAVNFSGLTHWIAVANRMNAPSKSQ